MPPTDTIKAHMELRGGVLDQLQKLSGLANDENMAGAIGVSVETYRRVKNGKQYPTAEFIIKLARAFKYHPELLFRLVADDETEEMAA